MTVYNGGCTDYRSDKELSLLRETVPPQGIGVSLRQVEHATMKKRDVQLCSAAGANTLCYLLAA